jgi:D-sedoheptulose 7-phosphate isomerase
VSGDADERVARCRRHFEEARDTLEAAVAILPASVARVAARCEAVLRGGGALLVCGNGGSAAESQHFAAELTGRFRRERRGWPVVALTTDSSALTAIANDYGFAQVFARQVEALGRPGDVLLVLSTSAASPNVVEAAARAHAIGMAVVAVTGPTPGPLTDLADEVIAAPGASAARVQEVHLALLHAMCDEIEAALTGA